MSEVTEGTDLAAVRTAIAGRLARTTDLPEQRRLKALVIALAGDDPTFAAYLTFRLERRQPGALATLARLAHEAGLQQAAAAFALDAAAAGAGSRALEAEMAELCQHHAGPEPLHGLIAGVLQDPEAPAEARDRVERLRPPRPPGRPPQSLAEALRRRLQEPNPSERDALRLGVLAAALAARDSGRALQDLRLLAGLSYWQVLAFVIDQTGPLDSPQRTALRKAVVGLHGRNLKLFGAALQTLPAGWLEPLDPTLAARRPGEEETAALAARALEARRARQPRFVLISGPMRSGTTLVSNLLYSAEGERPRHPAVAITADSIDLLRRLGVAGRGSAAFPDRLDLAVERRQTGSSARAAALLRTAILGRIAFDAPTLGAPEVVGFKSTGLTSEFELARGCFADARLILCLRDPRDVVASNCLRHFGVRPRADSLSILAHLLDTFALAAAAGDDVHLVRYEEVVAAPEGEVRRLLRFLGVQEDAYDWPALGGGLSDNSSYRQGGALSEAGHGIARDSVGRWRDHLSPVETGLVAALCGPEMVSQGYLDAAPGLDPATRDWGVRVLPEIIRACGRFGTDTTRLTARGRALGLLPPDQD